MIYHDMLEIRLPESADIQIGEDEMGQTVAFHMLGIDKYELCLHLTQQMAQEMVYSAGRVNDSRSRGMLSIGRAKKILDILTMESIRLDKRSHWLETIGMTPEDLK